MKKGRLPLDHRQLELKTRDKLVYPDGAPGFNWICEEQVGRHIVKSQTGKVSFIWLVGFGFSRRCSFDYPGTWDLELRDSPSLWLQHARTKGRCHHACSNCFCVGFWSCWSYFLKALRKPYWRWSNYNIDTEGRMGFRDFLFCVKSIHKTPRSWNITSRFCILIL